MAQQPKDQKDPKDTPATPPADPGAGDGPTDGQGGTPPDAGSTPTSSDAGEGQTVKDPSAANQHAMAQKQMAEGGRPLDSDAIVVRAGEKPAFPTKDESAGTRSFVIEQDVIAEVAIEGAKRPSHILLFHKGQVVTEAELKAKAAAYGAVDR